MLSKFKSHHIKKVLWGLVIVIVPAFIFWGAASFMETRGKTLGRIGTHTVSSRELNDYLKLARIQTLAYSSERSPQGLDSPETELQAWRLYLLLWKAKQDKIRVSDRDVVNEIRRQFSFKGSFDKETYLRFVQYRLRVTPREFEEYIRNTMIIERLFEKYATPEVTDAEVLGAYEKENEKAKIAYISLPFTVFEQKIEVSDEKLAQFYDTNKTLFKEAPEVKIRYIFVNQELYPQIKESLNKTLERAETLEDISAALPQLTPKETEFMTEQSPIEGVGWAPEIIARAFELGENKISGLQQVATGYIIFVKTGEKETRIPSLAEIKDKVSAALKNEEARTAAQEEGEKILADIAQKKEPSLETTARQYQAEFHQTDFFKYYDYIDGVGLAEDLSKEIFSAEKGTILAKLFSLPKGIYIVQLTDFLPIDPEKFQEEKEETARKLTAQKTVLERLKFLGTLEKESGLKIYSSLYQ